MADDDERAFYDGLRERIREARIAAGLTQQQLGDVMGLSRQSVNNVEMGRHNLTVLNYLRAIQALQLQVGDLLDDVPLPTITPIVQRRIRYVAPDGQTVLLVVPWPDGTGRIPPPSIDFYDHTIDNRVTFIYQGEA